MHARAWVGVKSDRTARQGKARGMVVLGAQIRIGIRGFCAFLISLLQAGHMACTGILKGFKSDGFF